MKRSISRKKLSTLPMEKLLELAQAARESEDWQAYINTTRQIRSLSPTDPKAYIDPFKTLLEARQWKLLPEQFDEPWTGVVPTDDIRSCATSWIQGFLSWLEQEKASEPEQGHDLMAAFREAARAERLTGKPGFVSAIIPLTYKYFPLRPEAQQEPMERVRKFLGKFAGELIQIPWFNDLPDLVRAQWIVYFSYFGTRTPRQHECLLVLEHCNTNTLRFFMRTGAIVQQISQLFDGDIDWLYLKGRHPNFWLMVTAVLQSSATAHYGNFLKQWLLSPLPNAMDDTGAIDLVTKIALNRKIALRRGTALLGSPHFAHNPRPPLKIAVCVSGQLRGYKWATSSWDALNLDPDHTDYYVHTWSDIGRRAFGAGKAFGNWKYTPELYKEISNAIADLGQNLVEAQFPTLTSSVLKPETATVEDLSAVFHTDNIIIEDENAPGFRNIRRDSKMTHKITACFNFMLSSDKKYDLVIRIRPDLLLVEKTKVDWHDVFRQCMQNNQIFMNQPIFIAFHIGIYAGDLFAVGGLDAMASYSNARLANILDLGHPANLLPAHTSPYSGHTAMVRPPFLEGIQTREFTHIRTEQLCDVPFMEPDAAMAALTQDVESRPAHKLDHPFLLAAERDLEAARENAKATP